MITRKPAEVFPPGDFIREELEARGWTQADLAKIMGRPEPAINQMINNKRGITAESALELSAAFGTSPEFWMNLDSAYRLHRAEQWHASAISSIQLRTLQFAAPKKFKSLAKKGVSKQAQPVAREKTTNR
jgi:HTH-type transcriptional regulator / antitoxin HigA